jgi:hypothetical protein
MQTQRNAELMQKTTGATRLVTDYSAPPKEYMHPWYVFKNTIPNSILNMPVVLIQ